ncbi:MAG: ankyrin repeat domain-containing protein [Minicystis sp.]
MPPDTCPDCRALDGHLHERFCLKERCPFCGGQLAACGCIHRVLALSEAERRAVEAYVNDGEEPLHGIIERWKAALDAKGRVPFRATQDQTMKLLSAASRGQVEIVRALLSAGTSPDAAASNGGTALMAAARSYQVEVVKLLLEAGADVQRQTSDGSTALHAAVGEVSRTPELQGECMRLLLARGAAPDGRTASGLTALMHAAWVGCLPAVQALLDAGASPVACDAQGRTAEAFARQRGHEAIAALLASRS